MVNNLFGKNAAYAKKLEVSLMNIGAIYPEYKGPWSSTHQLAARLFYADSNNSVPFIIEIGRLDDTKKAATEGKNVQSASLGNWTPVANDCWMLGAFHARKDFRLNTMNTKAMWDDERPGTSSAAFAFPVTRREISSLLHYKFTPKKIDGQIIFENPGSDAVFNATIEEIALTTTLAQRTRREMHDFMSDYGLS